jgi:hypothetical protein
MRRLPKIMTLVVAGLVVIGIAFALGLRLFLFRHPCDRVQTVLSRDGRGRTVVSVFDACTAVGTSVQESVDLLTPPGNRVRLFTFVPWGGEIRHQGEAVTGPFKPSATWITPSDLRLSIGTVDRVIHERSEAEGVRITYDVGTDLSK